MKTIEFTDEEALVLMSTIKLSIAHTKPQLEYLMKKGVNKDLVERCKKSLVAKESIIAKLENITL